MEAGVGIEFEENNILFKINKKITLQENIDEICKRNGLANSTSYGLKFCYTATGLNSENYVTDENFRQIQDGYTLKLVESLESLINNIFNNINEDREHNFEKLLALATDPGFIKKLVETYRDKEILQWLSNNTLTGKEVSACLRILLHLLKKHYVKEIEPKIIKNTIQLLKSNSSSVAPSELQSSLAVLCQVLYLKGLQSNKEMIISELGIPDLIPFIWSQDHTHLQLNTMMLMNAIVKSVKGEKRNQLIKELNLSINKSAIFKYIIQESKIDNAMAHELYVYQTYILSTYANALKNYLEPNNNIMLSELENTDDELNRAGSFIEFEEVCRSRSNSTGTILREIENVRISLASMESGKSTDTFKKSKTLWEDQVSYLTYECLLHYKKYHYKNFRQSLLEENAYEPGIFTSSERIIRLLSNILHIGREPTRSATFYHPVIFNCNLQLPFLPELFSRTMWLLSKTRREMKAWTFEDYSKVLVVLEKQVKMVLGKKTMDYKSLTKEMIKITYETVDQQWQKEKDAQWKEVYEKNPSVQTLKDKFKSGNEELIFQNRIKTLQNGDVFPKLPEKKGKPQLFYLRLSENKRTIIWGDWDETHEDFKLKEPDRFNLSDIQHFIIGKASPHVKDHSVKESERAFSIILEEGAIINFLAKDIKTANLWIDGFNLLLGKPERSSDFTNELETLLEMDCALYLLDLQNITIPNVAPIIPPLPTQMRTKPALPPKSPKLVRRSGITMCKQRNTRQSSNYSYI